eukprot:2168979-Amphidinium_carterae.2
MRMLLTIDMETRYEGCSHSKEIVARDLPSALGALIPVLSVAVPQKPQQYQADLLGAENVSSERAILAQHSLLHYHQHILVHTNTLTCLMLAVDFT